MPYWLSLLADLLVQNNRPGAARATLDAAMVAGQARDDLWWLPEVMRMRAAHDGEAASGADSAAQMAVPTAVSRCSGVASVTSPSAASSLGSRRFPTA